MLRKWIEGIVKEEINRHHENKIRGMFHNAYGRITVLENKPQALAQVVAKHKVKNAKRKPV
jgi:hypothetical protein